MEAEQCGENCTLQVKEKDVRKRYSQKGAYKKDTASGEKAKVNCADNRL